MEVLGVIPAKLVPDFDPGVGIQFFQTSLDSGACPGLQSRVRRDNGLGNSISLLS
jgi:hypothetical protein